MYAAASGRRDTGRARFRSMVTTLYRTWWLSTLGMFPGGACRGRKPRLARLRLNGSMSAPVVADPAEYPHKPPLGASPAQGGGGDGAHRAIAGTYPLRHA